MFYTGVGAFCLSNASKSGIRFLTFDTVKSSLPRNKDGRPTPVANMLAGTAAGIAEGVTVVTPGENLKTKVVHDRATVKQYRSSTHALGMILRSEGISGLYRGVLPVTMKQGTNALVRFTSYGAILDAIKPSMQRNGSGALAPTIAGALAGVVTVYATMPFDNVKTKMQALDGKALYRSTWHCFCTILAQSGVAAFWKGTTPRLIRLSVSSLEIVIVLLNADGKQVAGAISFSVYSNVVDFAQRSQTITIRKDTVAL